MRDSFLRTLVQRITSWRGNRSRIRSCFQTVVVIVCLGLMVALLALPSRDMTWSLIDDSVSMLIVPSGMLQAIEHGQWLGSREMPALLVLERTEGRVRPIFWLVVLVGRLVAGTDIGALHLIRFVWLLVLVLLTFAIAYLLTHSTMAGFIAGYGIALFGPGLPNVYRLVPQELPLATFAALAMVFLVATDGRCRSRRPAASMFVLSVVFLVLTFGTKEIAVVFVAFALSLLAVGRFVPSASSLAWKRYSVIFLLISIVMSGMILGGVVWSNTLSSGYGSFYGQGGLVIFLRNLVWFSWTVFSSYSLLLVAAMFTFVRRLVTQWRRNRKMDHVTYWQLCFLAWFLSGLVFQSPWRTADERYLMPYVLGLALFLGIELGLLVPQLIRWNTQRKALWMGVLVVGCLLFLWENLADANIAYQNLRWRDQSSFEVVQYLAEHAPVDSTVWTNLPLPGEIDSEFRTGVVLLLGELFGRRDLTVSSLKGVDVATCCSGEMVALWTHAATSPPEVVQAAFGQRAEVLKRISYRVERIWSPGAWLEHLVLENAFGKANRAPQDTYVYNWTILWVDNHTITPQNFKDIR